jgi:hypothetical protein
LPNAALDPIDKAWGEQIRASASGASIWNSRASRVDERSQLRRMRTIATGLLLAMLALLVASVLGQPHYPWLAWVRAFAEAGPSARWPTGTRWWPSSGIRLAFPCRIRP